MARVAKRLLEALAHAAAERLGQRRRSSRRVECDQLGEAAQLECLWFGQRLDVAHLAVAQHSRRLAGFVDEALDREYELVSKRRLWRLGQPADVDLERFGFAADTPHQLARED